MFDIPPMLKKFTQTNSSHHSNLGLHSSLSQKNLLFSRTNASFSQISHRLFSLTTGNKPFQRNFVNEVGNVQPPIGVSDFRKLIDHKDPMGQPYLFIDKSLFIKDILYNSPEVILITRPRRFGKTLNMSMLHHFFSKKVDNKPTKELFDNLTISQHKEYMKYQGQFPVIFLTFKDIKSSTFKSSYEDLCELIRKAYLEHEQSVLSSPNITDRDKRDYELILDRKAPDTAIRSALKNLTVYLNKSYNIKPIVLIDEYDTPIQTAYVKKYYEEMITFMREFLSAGLKDNSNLEKAVLTGILRVSKESLFSGLNNIKTYTLLNSRYGEYFGFTETEVNQLLEKSKLNSKIEEVRGWYNGYQAGNIVIYNPWSIVNYIQEQGQLSSYWVNTSDNALIKDLLVQSSTGFKAQFESLLQDKSIEMLINENIIFNDLETNESAIWSLLLMSGYLKATVIEEKGQYSLCHLQIPNKEVKDLYQTFIAEWLSGINNATAFNNFLNDLLNGKIEEFEDNLKKIMLQTFSVHDIKGKNPEKFFHGFMLGLIAGIDKNQYKIDSNKESGLGRYDIIIAPSDPKKLGIILEIKSLKEDDPGNVKEAANNALKQIDERQYDMATLLQDVRSCLKIGIAFRGKELSVAHHLDKNLRLSLENNSKNA